MADIKERLRAPPDLSDIHIICKAAGELREAVDRITALEAEVERMRAALKKIRNGGVWIADHQTFIDAVLNKKPRSIDVAEYDKSRWD